MASGTRVGFIVVSCNKDVQFIVCVLVIVEEMKDLGNGYGYDS